ncbi:hypothetical protein N7451_012908 [Penicillium sp. IBT 35674x]|nr:hypothetical protein N7451_012908 [Penicillium sp. IBT 35674x]
MLQALQEQPYDAARELPEPSVGIQMCDAREKADPVLHIETIIDGTLSDHCLDGQRSISLAALRTHQEIDLQAPLKSMSSSGFRRTDNCAAS